MLHTGPPVSRALVTPDWHRISFVYTSPQPCTGVVVLLSPLPRYCWFTTLPVGISRMSWSECFAPMLPMNSPVGSVTRAPGLPQWPAVSRYRALSPVRTEKPDVHAAVPPSTIVAPPFHGGLSFWRDTGASGSSTTVRTGT